MLQIKDHPTKATVYRAGDTWIRQYKSMHDLIHDAGKIDSSVASGTFERGCDWTWGGGHDDVPGTLRKIGNGLPLPDADFDKFEQAQRDFKRAAAKAMDMPKSVASGVELTSAWAVASRCPASSMTTPSHSYARHARPLRQCCGSASDPMATGTLTQRDWRTRQHWQQA